MNINSINKKSLIAAVLLFLLSEPFFVWPICSNNFVVLSTLLIFCVLFWSQRIFDSKRSQKLCILWTLSLLLLWFGRGLNFFGIFQFLLLFSIPFASVSFMKSTSLIFRDLMAYLLALSGIFYIMHILGVTLPHSVIPSLNPLKDYDMLAYPFFTLENTIVSIGRFPAYWDEPGALGTYAILLLGINKFQLNDWKDYVFIINGLLSLSLFFYVCFFPILIIRMLRSKNFFSYVLILSTIILLAYYIFNEDTILYQIIGTRLQIDDQTGTIAGNNRMSEDGDLYFQRIAWNDMSFLFGARFDPNVVKIIGGSFSYQTAILLYGLIPFISFVTTIIIIALRCIKNRIKLLIFLSFLCVILYQRPEITNPVYIFLFFVWIVQLSDYYNLKRESPHY